MKIILSIFVLVNIFAGITASLQQFGQPCVADGKEEGKACDTELGLFCSESLKVCECKSVNGTAGTESFKSIWSKGECAIKVQDTCLIRNSTSSSGNETQAEPSPLRCVHNSYCLNGTCQCTQGHYSSKDLTTCKSGAFSISGFPLLVVFGTLSLAFLISH